MAKNGTPRIPLQQVPPSMIVSPQFSVIYSSLGRSLKVYRFPLIANTVNRSAAHPPSRGKNLLCGICREVYRSPRILPCTHTFCLHCLHGMVLALARGTSFPCPTCSEVVNVPPGGVQYFKENCYITEEELEKERNAEAKSYCSIHPTEELIFFCKECDDPICIRCRLTEHDHGPKCTEDLCKAASRFKEKLMVTTKRLKNDVNKTTMVSAAAQKNIKSMKLRTDFLKDMINSQHCTLVSLANKCRDQALSYLNRMSQTLTQQMTTDAQTVQLYLDTLIRQEQRVNHVMGSNNHAAVVTIEKEMREDGTGTTFEQLKTMEQKLPSTTFTQLPIVVSKRIILRVEDIKTFIGSNMRLLGLMSQSFDDVTLLYRCPATAEGREIHALFYNFPYGDEIFVTYGGRAPNYQNEHLIHISSDGLKTLKSDTHFEKKIVFAFEGPVAVKTTVGAQIFGNTNKKVKLDQTFADGQVTIRHINTAAKFNLHGAKIPLCFDAVMNCEVFVILSENVQEPTSTPFITPDSLSTKSGTPGNSGSENRSPNHDRRVQMYLRNQSDPVCSYTPPQQPFFPTAVCFCCISGQELLLIADLATDTIHLVDVARKLFRFVRYLVCGSPYLVQPTALFSNIYGSTGEVLIGCQNGWVLKCTLTASSGNVDEDDDRPISGESDTETGLLCVNNTSSTTNSNRSSGRQLTVGNGSVSSATTTNSGLFEVRRNTPTANLTQFCRNEKIRIQNKIKQK